MRRLFARREATVAGLLAIAVVGNALGYLYWFDAVWSYDKLMHCYTSFAIVVALAAVLRDTLIARLRAHRRLMVCTLIAYVVALGVLWEIAEWLVDIGAYPQIIKGKSDTMADLIADGIGAWLAALLVTRRGAGVV